MSWRLAKSLETLRHQIDQMSPNRNKSSDGTIGDLSHQQRKSDHNPNSDGVVTAIDITNDPVHGVNAREIAEMLRLSQDPRIKYVISNREIFSSPGFSKSKPPWQWRHYDGVNAHTRHFHVSALGDKALYDDTRAWAIDRVARVQEPLRLAGSNRCLGITATVFGGIGDPNSSAYDGHFITDSELGVALPDRLKSRPKVRVFNSATGTSVDCDIVDVGPWNTDDPYWETGERPQAETGTDRRGRRTNLAGIDLTPAAAQAIGIPGKGKVDWEFIGAPGVQPGETKMPTPATDLSAVLQQVLGLLQTLQKPQPTPTVPTPPSGQLTPENIKKILDIVTALSGGAEKLGPVNGALGQTVGELINGKKTALGIGGSLVTTLLAQWPALSGPLSTALGLGSTAVAPFMLPIFLALTAWGVLGKMEKWSGASKR